MLLALPKSAAQPMSEEVRLIDPDTGGAKGRKPERMSLLPVEALRYVSRVYDFGSQKYDDHNWRKG